MGQYKGRKWKKKKREKKNRQGMLTCRSKEKAKDTFALLPIIRQCPDTSWEVRLQYAKWLLQKTNASAMNHLPTHFLLPFFAKHNVIWYGIFIWNIPMEFRLATGGVGKTALALCGCCSQQPTPVCYQHPPGYKHKAQHFQGNVNPIPARATPWVSVVTSWGTPSSDMCWCVPVKRGGKEPGLVQSFGWLGSL